MQRHTRAALRRRAVRTVSFAVMALFGFSGLASAGSISTTGPDSTNSISTTQTSKCTVRNYNDVNVTNSNDQNATTGDATVGGSFNPVYWEGWETLDPTVAQTSGQGFTDWWTGVSSWLSNHGDESQWNSLGDNTAWLPASNDWASWDPAVWQTNGQTYANWLGSVTSWLNTSAAPLLVSWPGGNTVGGDAVSGDATNTNSFSVSIHISNNAASMCGFTAPTGGGGGGGTTFTPPAVGGSGGGSVLGTAFVARPAGGSGGGVFRGTGTFSGGGVGFAAPRVVAPSAAPATVIAPVTQTQPVGGGGGGTPVVPPSGGSGGSIDTTGPGSDNSINTKVIEDTHVTNSNTISITNTNTQTATSGSATVSTNTTAGSAGSGDGSNGNGTGAGVTLGN